MINLLSTEHKDEIRAARTNVILLRYMSIITLALLFLGGALYVSATVLTATKTSAEKTITSNDIKADVYSETKNSVDTLSAQLNSAKPILDQEVRYSQVLVKLGQAMPVGTVLGNITLNSGAINGAPLEFTAYAKSTNETAAIQSQLQSSGIFMQVTIKGTEDGKGIQGYPVAVQLTGTLNRAGLH